MRLQQAEQIARDIRAQINASLADQGATDEQQYATRVLFDPEPREDRDSRIFSVRAESLLKGAGSIIKQVLDAAGIQCNSYTEMPGQTDDDRKAGLSGNTYWQVMVPAEDARATPLWATLEEP